MNILDRMVGAVSPMAGLRRAQARAALAYYEGAKPSSRIGRSDNRTSDALESGDAAALRAHARHLERNHDLSGGTLRVLVNNVVKPSCIGVQSQPRRTDGSIHTEHAAALPEAHRDWQKRPKVTGKCGWASGSA